MSLRIRFRFDGRCGVHPRYNPSRDGRPQEKNCPGCESLYVIHLYVRIARKRAESGDGILVDRLAQRPQSAAEATSTATSNEVELRLDSSEQSEDD